ncbi:MAG: hypothetical protein FWG98_10610 [Candidatus Cloacimonetes bacterium]|nr:hypothetical protein [Candidatus Cloacimonadota bacterium]
MKHYSLLAMLILITVSLFGINFHPFIERHSENDTEVEIFAKLDLENIETNGFEIIEFITVRERNGVERTETWKGVRFLDVIRRWTHLRNWDYELLSTDGYLVRLNIQDLALYTPIIAFERNSIPLQEGRWRLVSQNMPEMYWIANITDIYERSEVVFEEPVRIWTHQTLLSQMRLYTNLEPFVEVQGYRFDDLFFTKDSPYFGHVRLVSKDGIEQLLPYPEYLKNAFLVIDNGVLSIKCPDMPTGMWLKDIMLIQTDGNIIFFHDGVDKIENSKYREFLRLISQFDWLESTANGYQPVTDWERINWSEIDYLLR